MSEAAWEGLLLYSQGVIIEANSACAAMFGYKSDELAGMDLLTVVDPRSRARVKKAIENQLETPYEAWLRKKDGTPFLVLVQAKNTTFGGREVRAVAIRNISQERQLFTDLQASENKFRALLENAPAGVAVVNGEGRITLANHNAEEMFGYDTNELIGQPIELLLPEAVRERHASYRSQYMENPETRRMGTGRDLLGSRKDGSSFLIEVGLSAVELEGGLAIMSFITDISERKQTEVLNQRLGQVLDSTSNEIYVADARSLRFIQANKGARQNLGYSLEELKQLTVDDISTSESKEELEAMLQPLIAGETDAVIFEAVHQRKDGTLYIAELQSQYFGAETPPVFVGIVQDITERKEAEEALRKSEANNRQILETVQEVVYKVDFATEPLQGIIAFVNPQVEAMLGISPDMFLKDPDTWFKHLHPDDMPNVVETTQRLVDEKRPLVRRYRFRHEQRGQYVWLEDSITPVLNTEGQVISILGAARDITERKEMMDALETAKMAADRANKTKSEFLSRMSHELRTPMNAILGFAQLLELDDLSPAQHESVTDILKGGRHLLALINEVLDISRIEAGRMSISLEPIRLGDVLNEVLDLLAPLAAKRGVDLSGVPRACEHHVLADRQRLKQVVLNLISNAIKYNHEGGGVSLRCEQHGEELRIMVTDTVAGLSTEDQAKVFTPFERLGMKASDIEGTGIGLALSRQLMELMGGDLGVESEIGQGSTFWLTLARVQGQVEDAKAKHSPALLPLQVPDSTLLYVEDNLTNVRLIERLIAHLPNVKLVVAMQGEFGFELAREHLPDLILLDLHLPDMSGLEVLRRLKDDLQTRDIPVVVLSADATPGQITRLTQDGAAAYLTKPFELQPFMNLLNTHLTAGSDEEA